MRWAFGECACCGREAAVRGCGDSRRREHGDTDQSQGEELPAHETGIL